MLNSWPAYITPSLSNGIFTQGKVYEVNPCDSNRTNTRIGQVCDDLGHVRILSFPVGGRCPHLKPSRSEMPNIPALADTRFPFWRDNWEWNNAGHWNEVNDREAIARGRIA